jgi:GNAT superfamily N-acetyltransferase
MVRRGLRFESGRGLWESPPTDDPGYARAPIGVLILAAASPAWTDIVQATAAVVGVIGVVGALTFSAWQIRLQRIDQRKALGVQEAQRALSLMKLLIDVERTLVERPHLAPYFQSGSAQSIKELPAEGNPLRDEVLACGLLFTDFAEAVGWQIETEQMSAEGRDGWRDYFTMLCRNNEAVRHVATRDNTILAPWTRWLLGVGTMPGLEFRNLRTSRDHALLRAIHSDLFLPNFPDPDEQEEPADWMPRLWGNAAPPRPQQHGMVAGIKLNDAKARSLAGFAFVERYRESRCGLLSYIAVDQRSRGQRLASTLFEYALNSARQAAIADGSPLRAVFAEIHNPQRVAKADDAIDPGDRVRIMASLGAMRVPIGYVQPALGEDSQRSDRLLLIAFPQDGERTLDSGVVREFLLEYFAALAVPDPVNDPDVIRMMRELGSGRIELLPLAGAHSRLVQPGEVTGTTARIGKGSSR